MEKRTYKTGRKMPLGWKSGEANQGAKIKRNGLYFIRKPKVMRYGDTKRMAEKYNLTTATIRRIRQGVLWK